MGEPALASTSICGLSFDTCGWCVNYACRKNPNRQPVERPAAKPSRAYFDPVQLELIDPDGDLGWAREAKNG